MKDPLEDIPQFPLEDFLKACRAEGKFVVDDGYYGPGETEMDGDRRFDRLVELKIRQLQRFVHQARPNDSPAWNDFSEVLLDLAIGTIRTVLQAQILYLRRHRDGVGGPPIPSPSSAVVNRH